MCNLRNSLLHDKVMGHSWDIQFTAFACNAESFAIAFLYFLFFSFSSVFLERLTRVLSFNAKKRVSVRNVPLVVLRDVCGPWDTTCFGLFILTSIHNIQKGNSWKLGNRMEDESRFKAQKTEKSSWYVKKSEEKENTKYSKKKIWLIQHVKVILILLLKNKSHQKI